MRTNRRRLGQTQLLALVLVVGPELSQLIGHVGFGQLKSANNVAGILALVARDERVCGAL